MINKAIEIGAMVLGSASLLTVSFLGFAVLSGVSLNEVAVVGRFFPEPKSADPDAARSAERPEGALDPAAASRPQEKVVASTLGLMSAYSLPSPYTQSELKSLADELKGRSLRLDQRSGDLDARERSIAEQEEAYRARFQALEDLQDKLDRFQTDLVLRDKELAAKETVERQADDRRYAEIGRVLAGFTPEKRTQLLAQYEPDEAARILLSLTPDESTEALSGLAETLPTDRAKEYVEAFSRASQQG